MEAVNEESHGVEMCSGSTPHAIVLQMDGSPPSKSSTPSQRPQRICPECEKRTDRRHCQSCRTPTIPASLLEGGAVAGPQIGMVLGEQYEIQTLLGEGGMGKVFTGVQLSMGRSVAIKVISREISADLPSIRRFTREARITSRLGHPHSIRVFDFGVTDEGLFYLVMELLKGLELAQVLDARGHISTRRALEISIQILHALHEAHEIGVVHRDLKPTNVFLLQVAGEKDFIKVMDFGIAKSTMNEELARVTRTGMIVGTPTYMSPEQSQGLPIDRRSDIYALGTMLHEMLTGQPPFDDESPVRILLMHVMDPFPRLATLRPDLPLVDELQAVVDRLTAKDPDDRPRDSSEAAQLLENLLRRIPKEANDAQNLNELMEQAAVEKRRILGDEDTTDARSIKPTDPMNGVEAIFAKGSTEDSQRTPMQSFSTGRLGSRLKRPTRPKFRQDLDLTSPDPSLTQQPKPERSLDDVATVIGPIPKEEQAAPDKTGDDDEAVTVAFNPIKVEDLAPSSASTAPPLEKVELEVKRKAGMSGDTATVAPLKLPKDSDDHKAVTVAFNPIEVEALAPSSASTAPTLKKVELGHRKSARRGGDTATIASLKLPKDSAAALSALHSDTAVVPDTKAKEPPGAAQTPKTFSEELTVSMDVVPAAPSMAPTATVSTSTRVSKRPEEPQEKGKKAIIVLALLALLGFSTVAALLLSRGKRSETQRQGREASAKVKAKVHAKAKAKAPAQHIQPVSSVVAAASVPPTPTVLPKAPPQVRLRSTPTGARVYDGDHLLGRTPIEIPLLKDSGVRHLVLRLEGHKDLHLDVDKAKGKEISVELRSQNNPPSRNPAPPETTHSPMLKQKAKKKPRSASSHRSPPKPRRKTKAKTKTKKQPYLMD